MSITLDNQGYLKIDNGTKILPLNKTRIEELNNNTFFSNESFNKYGRELVFYMCNRIYSGLTNPEPVNLEKNTLSKVLTRLRIIDNLVKKPLEDYTSDDLNRFMSAFENNRILVAEHSNKKFQTHALGFYIREFKRLYRVFRQYQINNNLNFNVLKHEWALNLKAPKIDRKHYEKFPTLTIEQIISLSNNLCKEEYLVRTLMAVNLMGRKCEMSNLTYKDLDFRDKGEIWVELPSIKKHSSEKVPVELFKFTKKPLLTYLEHNKFKDNDKLFPSNEPAYTKNLKEVSEKMFRQRVTPKTLRKLGVCAAEKLGYGRADVERIGGWAVNSPVLEHYFNRGKGVAVIKKAEREMEQNLYPDIYAEFEKYKSENRVLKSQVSLVNKQMSDVQSKLKIILGQKLKEKNAIA